MELEIKSTRVQGVVIADGQAATSTKYPMQVE